MQWWKINISDIFKNIWNFLNQILTSLRLNSIVLLALGPNKVLYFSDVVHKKIYSSHLDGDWKAQGQEVINVGRSRSQKKNSTKENLKVVFGFVNQTRLSTVDSFCYSCTVLNSMTSLICFKLQEQKISTF